MAVQLDAYKAVPVVSGGTVQYQVQYLLQPWAHDTATYAPHPGQSLQGSLGAAVTIVNNLIAVNSFKGTQGTK